MVGRARATAAATLEPPAGIGPTLLVHGSCVASQGQGVLLRGPSGSGKSDLALRLVEAGFELVGDDQLVLTREGGELIARAPANLRGLIEVRGLGILRLRSRPDCRLRLVVDLGRPAVEARLPPPGRCRLLGVGLPRLRIDPAGLSATARIRFALEAERVH